jgi:hypothetical protein
MTRRSEFANEMSALESSNFVRTESAYFMLR